MPSMIDALRSSIDELHGRMSALEERAASEGRDSLDEHEQYTWNQLRAEADAKTGRLEDLIGRHESDMRARRAGGPHVRRRQWS